MTSSKHLPPLLAVSTLPLITRMVPFSPQSSGEPELSTLTTPGAPVYRTMKTELKGGVIWVKVAASIVTSASVSIST